MFSNQTINPIEKFKSHLCLSLNFGMPYTARSARRSEISTHPQCFQRTTPTFKARHTVVCFQIWSGTFSKKLQKKTKPCAFFYRFNFLVLQVRTPGEAVELFYISFHFVVQIGPLEPGLKGVFYWLSVQKF